MHIGASRRNGLGGGTARWLGAAFVASVVSWGPGGALAQMVEPWMDHAGYQAPSQPQQKVQGDTVYTTTQINTEIRTSNGAPPQGGTVGAGLDAYIGKKRQTYVLPLAYNVSQSWGLDGIVPFVVANHRVDGDWSTDAAVGDLVLAVRNRTLFSGLEVQSILSAKLANGNEEKELGTGAYDFALTEKLVVPLERLRLTFMLGYTYRGDDARIDGETVDYGDGFAWLAAVDVNIFSKSLWLGLRATGLVQGATRADGESQNDRLVTVDLAPEAKYFVTAHSAVALGVLVPVFTRYDVKGADPREFTFNASLYSIF